MRAVTKRWIAAGVLTVLVALAIIIWNANLSELLRTPGALAKAAFVLVVIIEVVVAPIPGGVIAFLAAAAWGFWTSWPLQYLGNVIGGLLVFWLARTLGKPFVDKHVDQKKRERIEKWLFGRPWLIWVVYAVPVFPIDTVSIVLGVSRISMKRFALILLTALPLYTGITAAVGAYFGQYIPYLEYFGVGVLIVLLGALVYLAVYLTRGDDGRA